LEVSNRRRSNVEICHRAAVRHPDVGIMVLKGKIEIGIVVAFISGLDRVSILGAS
jgi:hypothetical protein